MTHGLSPAAFPAALGADRQSQRSGISRRDLLRGGLAALAGGALGRRASGGNPQAPAPAREGRRVFAGYRGLAKLPYFELDADGRLVCTAADLPPIFDAHTHLAFSYLFSPDVDLLRSCDEVSYLFDCEGVGRGCEIELEPYSNAIATAAMRRDLDWNVARFLLPGGSAKARTHTVPNLLREMDAMGVERSLVLPIELGLPYGDTVTEGWMSAIQRAGAADRLLCLGSVHPSDEGFARKLERFRELGAAGVKLHPTMQRFSPDEDRALRVFATCERLGLPVFLHTGRTGLGLSVADELSAVERLAAPVAAFPRLTFVFGHAGAKLDFDAALLLAKRHENVWLDLSCQGLTQIQRALSEADPHRIIFGSDWPFYPQALTLSKVLIATEGERNLRRLVLHENSERLFCGRSGALRVG